MIENVRKIILYLCITCEITLYLCVQCKINTYSAKLLSIYVYSAKLLSIYAYSAKLLSIYTYIQNDRGFDPGGEDMPYFTTYMKARIFCERQLEAGDQFEAGLEFLYNELSK